MQGVYIKHRKFLFLFVSFALVVQLLAQPISVLAQTPTRDYTVQGLLEIKSVRYSAENKSYYYDALTYGFEACVSDCQWSIKLGTHDPTIYDSRIVSSDGEDTYLLLSYETRRKLKLDSGWNIGDGTVRKGNIPCFEIADEAGAVWIAYASGCYFAQHASDKRGPVPFASYVGSSRISPGDNPVFERASISLDDNGPHLPRTAIYYIEDLAKEWSIPNRGCSESVCNWLM